MTTIIQLLIAFVCGFGIGAVYFIQLWRSTIALVSTGTNEGWYIISRLAALVVIIGVSAAALSLGVSALNAVTAMVGFFLSRVIAMRWARPKEPATPDCLEERHAS